MALLSLSHNDTWRDRKGEGEGDRDGERGGQTEREMGRQREGETEKWIKRRETERNIA